MDLSGIAGISNPYSSGYAEMMTEKAKTDSFQEALNNASKSGDDKKLMNACVEFESYFMSMMLKTMRSTINTADSFIPKSQGEEIFQDMLDDEYCKNAANTGNGIGLAKMMYEQMKR